MRALILWVYAGILACCLIFLLVLVTNESELAKFQNGVSAFMQSEHVSSNNNASETPPPTYSAVAGGPSTQHTEAAHNTKAESNSVFVISLTSIANDVSQQWLQHFTKQGVSGN
ncbi:hypothetical protein K2V61_00835 [Staphylococcus simulans]|uniref:hypothetical protein n=1 Tax=Staphylococcus TaxID=1279 RepID=UPI000DF774B5|nr:MULTISPECIES: hypothetical protein [Staphylococcus]MCD8914104.1 hypothetical protein [Staphylococcus simulans]